VSVSDVDVSSHGQSRSMQMYRIASSISPSITVFVNRGSPAVGRTSRFWIFVRIAERIIADPAQ
jgi:hypothetical protein